MDPTWINTVLATIVTLAGFIRWVFDSDAADRLPISRALRRHDGYRKIAKRLETYGEKELAERYKKAAKSSLAAEAARSAYPRNEAIARWAVLAITGVVGGALSSVLLRQMQQQGAPFVIVNFFLWVDISCVAAGAVASLFWLRWTCQRDKYVERTVAVHIQGGPRSE